MKNKNVLLSEDNLQSIMEDKFGRYSKYIIQDRALPDVRDGLKPVQRRVLYAMWQLNLKPDKPYKKSARVVGDVIGKYHPHGDSSVYAAMVRMAQNWKVPHTLVDMHGNKGSIDGDPAAAMRYTEVRLASIAEELLEDINKDTAPFILNFDDSELEPTVLPAYYSNFIVNGAKGIASGYATETPPHNLGEVIDATKALILEPHLSTKKLMKFVKGPDFPTSATIFGLEEIYRAYETGKGRLLVRSTIEVHTKDKKKPYLNVTDIPFEADKPSILKKIEEIIIGKKIAGLKSVRDESDRNGVSIIVELESSIQNPQIIVQYLYKNTGLQSYYNINMVAIADRRPTILSLSQALLHHIAHMKEIVERKSRFLLSKALNRQDIIEGLIKAISILDEVIRVIRNSQNKSDAIRNLIKEFKFTEVQATAIVNLRLYRLTSTDIVELQSEVKELKGQIKHLKKLLKNEDYLNDHLIDRLDVMRDKYATPRKTTIVNMLPNMTFNISDVVKNEEVGLIVTKDGFLRRLTFDNFREHKNELPPVQDNDAVVFKGKCMSKSDLILITNKGNFVSLPIYKLTTARWSGSGEHINVFSHIEPDEKIILTLVIENFKELKDETITLVTKKGMVKRSYLRDFQLARLSKAVVCMKLKGEDRVVSAFPSYSEKEKIIFVNSEGGALRYPIKETPIIGLRTGGVKGMKVNESKDVVLASNDFEQPVILFYPERAVSVEPSNIPIGRRASSGGRVVKLLRKKQRVIGAIQSNHGDILTIVSQLGDSKALIAKDLTKKIIQSENYKFSNKLGLVANEIWKTNFAEFQSETKPTIIKQNPDGSDEESSLDLNTVEIIDAVAKRIKIDQGRGDEIEDDSTMEIEKRQSKTRNIEKKSRMRKIKDKITKKKSPIEVNRTEPSTVIKVKPTVARDIHKQQKNDSNTEEVKAIAKNKSKGKPSFSRKADSPPVIIESKLETRTKRKPEQLSEITKNDEKNTVVKRDSKKQKQNVGKKEKQEVQPKLNIEKKETINKNRRKPQIKKTASGNRVKLGDKLPKLEGTTIEIPKPSRKFITASKQGDGVNDEALKSTRTALQDVDQKKAVQKDENKVKVEETKGDIPLTKVTRTKVKTKAEKNKIIQKRKNTDDTDDHTLVDFSIGDILDED